MLNILIAIYFLLVGLILGSFFNVCIYRIPRGESVAFPPSHCTSCNTRLKPLDLIPVLSYLFLGRKCRYCGEKISSRYAIVELLTGILFLSTYLVYGISFELVKYLILICFMIVIGMIDYDTTDVYTITTMSGIAVGVILTIAGYFYFGGDIKTYIYGAILGGGVITFIILLTRGMGWGDAEICALCGLYLGFSKSFVLLFFSFVLGGILSILLIVTKIKSRKDYIPFGPFIAIAAVITILFGDKILAWYL